MQSLWLQHPRQLRSSCFKVISDFAIDLHDVWHFAFFRNIRIFVFRGLKEDVSLFEVEGFSLMTLVTIMESIL